MRQFPAAMLGLLFTTGFAAAQELAPLTDLAACRLNQSLVALSFSYDGGACEQPGEASADVVEGTSATVTVPVVPTAEVCTMQSMKVAFSGSVAVDDSVEKLTVQVTTPGGEVAAEGSTDIAPESPDCAPPKEGE